LGKEKLKTLFLNIDEVLGTLLKEVASEEDKVNALNAELDTLTEKYTELDSEFNNLLQDYTKLTSQHCILKKQLKDADNRLKEIGEIVTSR
jgi:predicted  nucleic acid-binding Zn-ribbon protein